MTAVCLWAGRRQRRRAGINQPQADRLVALPLVLVRRPYLQITVAYRPAKPWRGTSASLRPERHSPEGRVSQWSCHKWISEGRTVPRRTEPKRVSAASAERTGFDRFCLEWTHSGLSHWPMSVLVCPLISGTVLSCCQNRTVRLFASVINCDRIARLSCFHSFHRFLVPYGGHHWNRIDSFSQDCYLGIRPQV